MGIVLARLFALALVALGIGAIAAPKPSSRGYGLPSDDSNALAFVRGMGVRDLVLGIIVARLAREDARKNLSAAVAASTLVAAGDFALVSRSATPEARTARIVHGSGVAALLVLWAILRAES